MRTFFVIFALSVAFTLSATRILFKIPSKWNRNPGWPGVKIRLTKKGAEHVKNVGVKILNEEISQLRGFSAEHSFSQPGFNGKLLLSNLQVLHYVPPVNTALNFMPPSYILLQLQGIDIALTGRFLGLVGLMSIQGAVTGDLRQLSISIQTEFKTAPDGLMQVRVVDCSTTVRYSEFYIDAEGPFSGLVKMFEVQINDAIRQQIPSVLCSSIQKFIEDASPALFKRLARADLSDQFKTPGPIGIPAVERLVHRFTKGLYIDNRNIADPTITYDFFETQQSGEIRYDDNPRRTPFFPSPMRTTNDSDRMLYFYGSEYLFNSLLFHAYEGNRLMLEIDESSLPPTYKPLLWTSCAKPTGGNILATFCLGKLIPAIAEKFPNATSSFVLIPHELPVFELIDGIGTIDLKTRVLTYINEGRRRRQILVSSTDVVADLRLLIDDHNFAADFKLHKLAVGLHRSAVDGISSEEISQMAPLAKTFLGPQLSKALRKGLPFPLQESLEFINPQLRVHDGFVELATDFRLGERKLRAEVKQAFQSKFYRHSLPPRSSNTHLDY